MRQPTPWLESINSTSVCPKMSCTALRKLRLFKSFEQQKHVSCANKFLILEILIVFEISFSAQMHWNSKGGPSKRQNVQLGNNLRNEEESLNAKIVWHQSLQRNSCWSATFRIICAQKLVSCLKSHHNNMQCFNLHSAFTSSTKLFLQLFSFGISIAKVSKRPQNQWTQITFVCGQKPSAKP